MDIRYFNELSQLHKSLPPANTDPRKLVNFCLNVGKSVVSFGKANPHLAFAILRCAPSETSSITRTLVAVYISQKANNANEHFIQHVLASILAVYWINVQRKQIGHKFKPLAARLREFLTRKQLNIWLDIIVLQKVMFSKNAVKYVAASSLNSIQRKALIGTVIANVGSTQPQTKTISECAANANVGDREFLARLLLLFERTLPLSSVLFKDIPATVLAADQEKVCILLNDGSDEVHWLAPNAIVLSGYSPSTSLKEYLLAFDNNKEFIGARAGRSLLPNTYPLIRPPGSLTSIIDTLQSAKVNINNLSKQIDEHDAFSQFLLSSASHDNRLQLPVNNIKQAVLTYGIERVGDMLVQFALMERLTQHYYPLRALSIQFTTIASHVASILCTRCSLNLTPQTAGLIITFMCAPLFTLPGLKVRTSLPVRPSGYFQPNSTFNLKLDGQWHDVAGELAGKWHQAKRTRIMIHQSSLLHHQVSASLKKEHAVIQLSFGLARELLFGIQARDNVTSNQLKQLLATLDLRLPDIESIQNELSDVLWCPL